MTAAGFLNGWRLKLRAWALRRQGIDRLPVTLAPRRIYILPTRLGWTFAMLLVVMFVAGMNYGNGMALLLTFWLTGFLLVAMVQTQRVLAGVQITSAGAAPAFAGTDLQIELVVQSRNPLSDFLLRPAAQSTYTAISPVSSTTQEVLALALPVRQRGLWHAPALRLESSAPFGLFCAWTWLHLDLATVIYPRPWGEDQVPESGGIHSSAGKRHAGQDELSWLRDFREGDSPRQVAWKAYAKGTPLLVREYHSHAAATHEFDYAALAPRDAESRLSQLCHWVVQAAQRQENWTLLLPGAAPRCGRGAQHLEQCLTALALHPPVRSPGP
jgi:uncharacterized protein (DUF58 family)